MITERGIRRDKESCHRAKYDGEPRLEGLIKVVTTCGTKVINRGRSEKTICTME